MIDISKANLSAKTDIDKKIVADPTKINEYEIKIEYHEKMLKYYNDLLKDAK